MKGQWLGWNQRHILPVGSAGYVTRGIAGHSRGPEFIRGRAHQGFRRQIVPRCIIHREMSQEIRPQISGWKTNNGPAVTFEGNVDPEEDQENGGGSQILDDLIGNVRDLELEVEKLQREQSEEIIVSPSCRFARRGGHQDEATDEGRDLVLFLPGVSGVNFEAADQFDNLSATFDVWSMEVRDNDKSTFVELTGQMLETDRYMFGRLVYRSSDDCPRVEISQDSSGGVDIQVALLPSYLEGWEKCCVRNALSVVYFMSIVGVTKQRQAVIIGSSFGALLAVNVAHQNADSVKGLMLVNPATSYGRSRWRAIGSLVANTPGPQIFGAAATLALATTIPDTATFSRYLRELEALPPQEVTAWFKSLTHEWSGRISTLFGETPQEQLQWRLVQWLEEGSRMVEPLLQELAVPVVVLAGSEDHMLPSVDEAARLDDIIPTCQPIVLRGVGHAALHNLNEVNLGTILGSSVIYDQQLLHRIVRRKGAKKVSRRWQKGEGDGSDIDQDNVGRDSVLDFELDLDDEVVNLTWESTQMMDRFTSPVFVSVNERGELQQGLGGVPDHQDGRSILFVGNHQILGLDMPILVRTILLEKDILVRGLAHPMVTGADTGDFLRKITCQKEEADKMEVRKRFGTAGGPRSWAANAFSAALRRVGVTGPTSAQSGGPRLDDCRPAASQPVSKRVGDYMAKLGAVPVTPRNMLRLFKAGEAVLLYPGGAREALHQKGQDYQMFWPEKSEFIRMAAACNATIVPFSAVGSADSVAIWMDLDDMFSLPFGVGDKMKDAADCIPRARQGDDLEYFLPPIVRPKVPVRHYFVFGPAVDTSLVDEKDREACQQVYDRTRSCVRGGIHYLLEARKHDPYGETAKRFLYETVMKTQAPTFPLDAATFGDVSEPSDASFPSKRPE